MTPKKTFYNIRREFFISLFLIFSTLAVYRHVANYEFVNYDDPRYTVENPYVKDGLSEKSILWSFTFNRYDPLWHPLTWLSLMLGCQLHGMDPGWHHLTNVFFHIANALLLFFLLRKMTGGLWQSAFVAALFALHPLNVESVAWVTERKNVLSTLFWFLTMWGYTRYVERPTVNRYLLALMFFVLGLMSKMMLVTLPFVLLLMDYWPLRRFRFAQSGPGNNNQHRASVFHLVSEKIPFLILTAAFCVVTFIGQLKGGGMNSLDILPLKIRIFNAILSYVRYLGKMVWPSELAVIYPYPSIIQAWQIAGAFLLLLSVSLWVSWAARRRPYLAVGWLWYIGTLVPVIGLVQVGNYAMANRYTYVPLIGIFIMIAWVVPELLPRWRYRNTAFAAIAGSLLCILMVATSLQARYWTNSITLFQYALDVTKHNYTAHNNLAIALHAQGKVDKAIKHYSEALRINPDFVEARNNLGSALLEQGRTAEAAHHYSEALRIDPDSADAHMNLGIAMASQGRTSNAMAHLLKALKQRPDYEKAHYNLGLIWAKKGNMDEAIKHYSEALRIKPNYEKVHNNLGIALAAQGKYDEAITHYSEAIRLNPHFAGAHLNLGNAFLAQGELDNAIRNYSEALRIEPDFSDAKDNLGKVLAVKGKFDRAFTEIQKKLQSTPGDPALHCMLGDLYKQIGALDKAIGQYQKALLFQPTSINAMNSLAMGYTLKGQYPKAITIFKKIIELRPDRFDVYYNIACLFSRQERIEESVDWLKKAVQKGYMNWDVIKTDKDLDNIRGTSYYQELIRDH
jgi:tetratricopeptide (TPR) repeat protein